jgi:DNA-binding PadR family transcriptional regulator
MAPSLTPHYFHILLALADGPRNGAAITSEVLERTEGQLQLWPGMLYTALRKLTADGFTVETDVPPGFSSGGGTPKFYKITAAGRRACAAEAARLSRIVETARERRLVNVKHTRG